MTTHIEYCYDSGDLAKALKQAADFVTRIGEQYVDTVTTNFTEDAGWTVMVVHTERSR
jgi:hypothetical protein